MKIYFLLGVFLVLSQIAHSQGAPEKITPEKITPEMIHLEGILHDKPDKPDNEHGGPTGTNKGEGKISPGKSTPNGKPGVNTVSKSVKDDIKEIRSRNSILGNGGRSTQVQRDQAIAELDMEKLQAHNEGRRADFKYIEKEQNKIRNMSGALKESPIKAAQPPPSLKPTPTIKDSRNDGSH